MAKQSFQVTVEFLGNINNLQNKLKELSVEMGKIGPLSGNTQVQKQFDQLAQTIQNLQTKAKQPIASQGEFNKLIQEVNKAEGSYNSLIGTLDRLYGLSDNKKLELIPKSEQARIKSAEEAIKNYANITEKASQKSREFKDVQNQIANQKGIRDTAKAEVTSYTAQLEEARNKLKKLQQQETELSTQLAQARANRDSARSTSGKESEEYKKAVTTVSELVAKQKALKGQIDTANNSVKTLGESFRSASERAKTAAETIKQLNANKKELNSSELTQLQTAFDQLKAKAKELGVNLQGINDVSNVDTLIQRMQQLKGDGLEQADAAIEKMANSANSLLNPALQRLRESAYDNTNAFEAFNRAQGDLESLKSRVGYFFSMTNSLMLLRRALTSALNTVKELDAVMTETAVVTDFTVGDMWEKLPEYSKQASALGASIKDLYSATTLYYQQGLNTEAAMGVGIETMKMARIANMEAADATQAMTAALRGFNMEVNEINATKVNDVYSELAAITAADTEQIATAMSKTASIAASANMEFETTSALLAQIIETTQEAPETAGTAMKTIIARFTEVKELFSEGMLTGEDEEGEEININKIDAALKTVGISLKDFLNGSKGIDDIFLELASKWDSLDLATQRYIATMAAGSRQQSRFIAMMSNYERTMELVAAANNSSGASQEQFNKTLESMEAKLQKMHNAWNQFTMGLANNQILKGGVDLLTGLLKAINGLTEAVSGGNGAVKSVLNLGVALMGLKAGGAVLSGILASISQAQGGQVVHLGKNIKTGFANAFSGIKNIKPNIPKIDFDTAGLKTYQASLASLGGTYQQVTAARIQYDSIAVAGDAKKMAAIALDEAEVAAEQQLIATSTQLAAATGLENAQAQQAVLLNSQGLSLDWAVAAAKAGVTAAELKEAAVKQLGVGATEAAVAAKMKEILAQQGVYVAINTGILGRIEEIAMTKLGIFSTLAKVAADKLETAGLKAKTAAMWASLGVIGLIIAAVTLLIAGIVALYKHAQATSLEGRMKAAAEATKQAQEAAEEAKSAYDELLNTKSNYSELQETLENLTQGTKEWKQALLEANAEVMKLLDTYPMLAQYVERGSDGQLTITEEGWQELQNQKYEQMVNTQSMVYGNQMVELDLKREEAQTKLDAQIIPKYIENENINYERAAQAQEEILKAYEAAPEAFYEIGQMTAEEFLKIKDEDRRKEIWDNSNLARKYGDYRGMDQDAEGMVQLSSQAGQGSYILEDLIANNGLQTFSDELYDLAAVTGFTAEELYNMRNSVADYDRFMEIYTQQIQTYADMFMTGIDAQVADSKFATQVTSGLAKNYTQQGASKITATKNSYTDKNTGKDNISKLANDLITEGYMITDTTGSNETYRQVYEALSGQEAGEMTTEQLATAIAEIQVGKDWSNAAEDLIKSLDKLASTNEEQAKIASAMISRDTSGLNISQIKKLEKTTVSDQAKNLGFKDSNEFAKAQGYEDKKITELNEADQLAAAKAYLAQEGERLGIDNVTGMLEYMKQKEVVVTAGLQLHIDTEQFKDELEAQRQDIISGIDSVMGEGYTEESTVLSNVSTQVLKNLSEQTSTMGQNDAKAYISNFEKVLSSSNLTEDQSEQLSNYLSSVDWSNMTEAVNAMDYMQSMGIDSATIENFWNAAINGANTYISSLSEVLSLTERLQGKIQNVNNIEKALADGTATYDQMMELVNAGVDISNFQLTPEGWKATADEIEGATDKLRQYNAEQARAVANQQLEKWEAAKSNVNDDLMYNKEAGQFDIIGQYGIGGITSTDASGKLVGGQVTTDQAYKIAEQLGENGYDASKETEDEFVARIQAAYDAYINLLNNGEDIQIIAEKTAAMAEAARYSDADQARVMGTSEESQIYVSQSEATEAGVDLAELEAYAAHLEKIKGLSKSMATEMAKDIMLLNSATKTINENWDQWSKDIKKIGTPEYSNALTSLQANMRKMLGTSVDLSEEFFQNSNNMDLIKKAAKGSQKAMNELQKAAARDLIKTDNLEQAKELFKANDKLMGIFEEDYGDLADTIADTDLKPGQVAGEELLGSINTMYQQAYMAAIAGGASVQEAMAQANAALASVGIEPQEIEWTEYTVTGTTPNGWEPIASSSVTTLDPTGKTTVVQGASTKFVPGEQYEYTMAVPNVKSAVKKEELGGGGGGGGGSSSSSKTKWENPYDEFYNTVEDINEELRIREKLERRYQALLAKTDTKASDLVKNAQDQIKSLERERELREGLLTNRNRQMSDIESEYSDLSKYAWYNEQDGTIEIDWEKIEALDGSTNEKLTSRIEEYITALEEQQDLIEEEEDSLDEIEETIREIRDQGKDEYFDLESQIKEALIGARQDEIDELSAINDSINDTNSRLIDAMQSSIDKYRQDRENEKTEEELADKQRRLAYLQQDTSGANALDIMQLQEELDQAQEDYTDTLIDQKISELQQQNDEAAEQRQQQIDIMNDQLQHDIATGAIWDKVYELMGSGIDEDGIKVGSSLWELLKDQQDYPSKSNLEKLDWAESLRDLAAQAVQWLSVGNSTEALIASGDLQKGQKITFKTADGKTVEGKLQDNGDIIADGKTYKDVRRNYDGSFVTEENYQDKETEIATTTSTPTSTTNTNSTKTNKQTNKGKSKVNKFSFNGVNYSSKTAALEAINKWEMDQISWEKRRWFQGQGGHSESYLDSRLKTIRTQANSYRNKLNLHKFKTGGLADFTGPAWLDGTKSKPEYILNSDQTKAFFELVDVLSGLKGGVNTSSQITGDSIYDVDINVESIGSDYDVEQLAQTVKRMINDDARYRNNNAINLSR